MSDSSRMPKQDPLQKLGRFCIDHLKLVIIILIVLAALLFLLHPMMPWVSQKKSTVRPIPVLVATAQTKDVPVYFSAIGTVNAVQTITVKTQISGILTHVYFQEGQMVNAGDDLAQIDPRPYEAQLLQYQGQLIRDVALLVNAKKDLKRYINLYQSKSVSQQTLDTQKSLLKQDIGAITIDQGQIDAVKTNLAYCNIISPVAGRIGLSRVTQGNLVQPSDTSGIAVITTLDPIQVIFSLPEDDLAAVATPFNAGKKLGVDVYDRDQNKLLSTGVLSAIDSEMDTSTGTIKFKANFNNKNNILFPNQFVNVNLKVSILKNALVVPTTAVQQGAKGAYVYRYNTNQTVSNIPVKTGIDYGEDTVILSGLSAHQIVITAGTDKLYEGAKVVAASTS